MNSPLITVVTVCFNAASTIERTIQSIQSQTWGAIEHVVVDGGSTDGTMDVVRRYADGIATIVSEKDAGIFDAMNKGVRLSHGDILYFLNADDSFVDDRVVEDIAAAFRADPTRMLVYGNVLLKGAPAGTGNFYAHAFRKHSISEFLHNAFCHQAVFVRRELFTRARPLRDALSLLGRLRMDHARVQGARGPRLPFHRTRHRVVLVPRAQRAAHVGHVRRGQSRAGDAPDVARIPLVPRCATSGCAA